MEDGALHITYAIRSFFYDIFRSVPARDGGNRYTNVFSIDAAALINPTAEYASHNLSLLVFVWRSWGQSCCPVCASGTC